MGKASCSPAKCASTGWQLGSKIPTWVMASGLFSHWGLMVFPQPKLMETPLPVPRGMTAVGGAGWMPNSLHTHAAEHGRMTAGHKLLNKQNHMLTGTRTYWPFHGPHGS